MDKCSEVICCKYGRFLLDSSLASVIHSVSTEYPFEGVLHNRAKIMLPHSDCLITGKGCLLTECALKYSALASYVTVHAITNTIINVYLLHLSLL